MPSEDNVKVTLSLSRPSLDFFKREARKRRVPDQRMIRALVDTYAEQLGGRGQLAGWSAATSGWLLSWIAASRISLRSIRATLARYITFVI